MGVAVVSYNTAALLRRCLHSIVADTNAPMLVVDNGSDGSADIVRREFPTVRVRVEENRGYGAAANIAVTQLETPYVLLLNADTELTPRTLQALTRYLDQHPRVAIAGPRIVNAPFSYSDIALAPCPLVARAPVSTAACPVWPAIMATTCGIASRLGPP